MIKLVKELKETMEDRHIGKEEAARIIDCANRILYYWLNDEGDPSVKMQSKIRKAIGKMKLRFPTESEQLKGLGHLETLKTHLSMIGMKVDNEEKAVQILGQMEPEKYKITYQCHTLTLH